LILRPYELFVDCNRGEGRQGLVLHQVQSEGESPNQAFSSLMDLLQEKKCYVMVIVTQSNHSQSIKKQVFVKT
jgi:hypothetical protein